MDLWTMVITYIEVCSLNLPLPTWYIFWLCMRKYIFVYTNENILIKKYRFYNKIRIYYTTTVIKNFILTYE